MKRALKPTLSLLLPRQEVEPMHVDERNWVGIGHCFPLNTESVSGFREFYALEYATIKFFWVNLFTLRQQQNVYAVEIITWEKLMWSKAIIFERLFLPIFPRMNDVAVAFKTRLSLCLCFRQERYDLFSCRISENILRGNNFNHRNVQRFRNKIFLTRVLP